jgi:predicted nucleic acid-binding protein
MASGTRRPLVRPPAFWDASALVPLCVRQGSTPQAFDWYKSYEVVVWWATPVEIASALARLLRVKDLNASQWSKAWKSMTPLAETWYFIPPSTVIRANAIKLVEHYDLRAADALQLAAALAWCDSAPHGRTFLTLDDRLQQAAMLKGFDIHPS